MNKKDNLVKLIKKITDKIPMKLVKVYSTLLNGDEHNGMLYKGRLELNRFILDYGEGAYDHVNKKSLLINDKKNHHCEDFYFINHKLKTDYTKKREYLLKKVIGSLKDWYKND